MQFTRVLRHLLVPDWWARRAFPMSSRQTVEHAITQSEKLHQGELRFVVEAGLPWQHLRSGISCRARAIELFAQLNIWDTEHNSGVLVYVQLIDRQVEIVADRGINAHVAPELWTGICHEIETEFRAGRFEAGALRAVERIATELVRYCPAEGGNPNELPDSVQMI